MVRTVTVGKLQIILFLNILGPSVRKTGGSKIVIKIIVNSENKTIRKLLNHAKLQNGTERATRSHPSDADSIRQWAADHSTVSAAAAQRQWTTVDTGGADSSGRARHQLHCATASATTANRTTTRRTNLHLSSAHVDGAAVAATDRQHQWKLLSNSRSTDRHISLTSESGECGNLTGSTNATAGRHDPLGTSRTADSTKHIECK